MLSDFEEQSDEKSYRSMKRKAQAPFDTTPDGATQGERT